MPRPTKRAKPTRVGRKSLFLESGRVIANVRAAQIGPAIEVEELAILATSSRSGTYMQCAQQDQPPYLWILEYQDKTIDEHYQADHPGLSHREVTTALEQYLADDSSWKAAYQWRKLALR